MSKISTELEEGSFSHGKLLSLLAKYLSVLAISKDELTEANVEPFWIDLVNQEPWVEKPLRYNRELTRFID